MIDIEGIKARLDIAENGIKCAEQTIENAKACFDKAKEMLDAKDAKPQRNWPERIEAGMCFGISEGGVECQYIVSDASRLVCIASNTPRMIGGKWNSESLFRGCESRFTYLGHARDILTIRTDAHEPTGAELVGILEDIRNVSNNPGRTLTTLGLTECLQSCNVMARNALDGIAR